MKAAYERVVLKLSGEVLAGEDGFGISPAVNARIAGEIRDAHALGAQIGLVIGGGNIIRGATASMQGMDRGSADYMGMLGSIINGMAIQDALEKAEVPTRVLTALEIK
ncbi:MAG TPA: UMP kinase, partial [Myxococcota bacterium]|nr:UMP kinase [Myxococcota bacterium]